MRQKTPGARERAPGHQSGNQAPLASASGTFGEGEKKICTCREAMRAGIIGAEGAKILSRFDKAK